MTGILTTEKIHGTNTRKNVMVKNNSSEPEAVQKELSFTEKIIAKTTDVILKARHILNQIYLGEDTFNFFLKKLINAVKVFIVATRKFLKDNCTTKASSIAYATIISLIPTLTVAITFYSIFSGVGNKKEEIFRKITLFMLEHNIRLNIDPVLGAISSLIDNAGKIGGVGAVIMIFTATAVLRTLEKSLNDIWGIKKNRPMMLRMIYYWAALTLGPIMLISGTTVATQISNTFSSPNYSAAAFTDNRVWFAGNQGQIQYSSDSRLKAQKVNIETFDFVNQRIHKFDAAAKTFIEDEFRLEPMDLKKATYVDMQMIGKRGWIVGKNGIILATENSGRTWTVEKWGSFNFNDIHMLSPQKGFIVTDNGYLLSTNNGAKTWNIREWEGHSSSFNHIAFDRGRGIISGDKGTILTTDNYGNTWDIKNIPAAKRKNLYVNLNHAHFVNTNTIWIVGNEGVMLTSRDSGKTWNSRFFQENNYKTAYFINPEQGFVAGDNGILLKTVDGGKKWRRISLTDSRINAMAYANKKLWIFGDNGLIMSSRNSGSNWEGIEGKSFIVILLNFFAPFIFIWLLFMLTYIILPNTKVPFKPAAIGAAFTGTVWVTFILLFIVYVKYFAGGSVAIYGALAAIPIFLLMVYASSLIILYGAEVSYTLMHPHTYIQLKKTLKDIKDIHVVYGLAILHHIYRKFETGNGETGYKELLKLTSNKTEEVDHFIEVFEKNGLILEKEGDSYIPSNSSKNILIGDIIELTHNVSLMIPPMMPSSGTIKKFMQKFLKDMESSRKEIIGTMTLQDMIIEK